MCILPLNTWADSTWHCQNLSAEISCSDEDCTLKTQQDFTPFHIVVSNQGQLSVCAYSGCWEGTAKMLQDENHYLFSAQKSIWSAQDNPRIAKFMLGIDAQNNMGFLQGEGFSLPLQCKPE